MRGEGRGEVPGAARDEDEVAGDDGAGVANLGFEGGGGADEGFLVGVVWGGRGCGFGHDDGGEEVLERRATLDCFLSLSISQSRGTRHAKGHEREGPMLTHPHHMLPESHQGHDPNPRRTPFRKCFVPTTTSLSEATHHDNLGDAVDAGNRKETCRCLQPSLGFPTSAFPINESTEARRLRRHQHHFTPFLLPARARKRKTATTTTPDTKPPCTSPSLLIRY